MSIYFFRFLFLLLIIPLEIIAKPAPWVGNNLKGSRCDGNYLNMSYGPFDYSNSEHRKTKLSIVERYHFGKEVQNLKKPPGTGTVAGGIMYTLTAFPNHYKALDLLGKYRVFYQLTSKKKRKHMKAINPAEECFFKRAINFDQKNATIRILFAIYLKKIKQYLLADKYYQQAITLAHKKEQLNFRNIYGLFLVKQKKFEQANEQAKIIYAKNFPRQKLKKKLIAAGVWK